MVKRIKTAISWLRPGLGIKRWLVFTGGGIILLTIGLALFLQDLYETHNHPDLSRPTILQFWPGWLLAGLFGLLGLAVIGYGLYRITQMLVSTFLPRRLDAIAMADMLHSARRRGRGPKIVTIGGGTGMSNLLRGLKNATSNITAIVTVADDGGSSGRLRRSLGILPPGDFRNCIAALADDEALTTQLFQYRFSKKENDDGLGGHSFGNLYITTMAAVTGSFEQALVESGRVLNIRGQILPSTLRDVTLYADLVAEAEGATRVHGESAIPKAPYPIERVHLEPDNPPAYPGAVRAILEADLIVLGPGSLYTSLLPNLLVPEIAQAIRVSPAPKVYICNVATQKGETDGYTLADHVAAFETHLGPGFLTHILVNNNLSHPLPTELRRDLVIPKLPDKMRYCLVEVDVIDEAGPWRHDSQKLARCLINWYQMEIQGRVSDG